MNLAFLKKYGVNVLGTQIAGIQKTEDRQLFKDSMNECDVPVLKSKTVNNFEDAKKAAEELRLSCNNSSCIHSWR